MSTPRSGRGGPAEPDPQRRRPARPPRPPRPEGERHRTERPERPDRPRPERRERPVRPSSSREHPSARRHLTAPKKPRKPQGPQLGNPRKRLRTGMIGLGVVASLFVGRLVQLQVMDASAYASVANQSRVQSVTLPAERGDILDANGVGLAYSVDAVDVTADPSMVKDPFATAAQLAPLLGVDPAQLEQKLRTPKSRNITLARQVDPEVWKRVKQLQTEYGKAKPARTELVGIFQTPHSKRVYSGGPLAANLIGWVNADDKGGGNLEMSMDKLLAGKPGKARYETSLGRRVPTAGNDTEDAVPGTNVQLTIDRNIQWFAEDLIAKKVAETGAVSGTVVVQDVKTGEVLAMATGPGFDPNNIKAADPANLGNRALLEAYEPGSTSKVMTMAAAIQENVVAPDTHVTVPNRLPRSDRLFKDEHDHPEQHLTLTGVLAKSSNIGTILTAERLGATQQEANAKLYGYLKKFGIGSPTGLNFPGETPGLLASPDKWSGSQQHTIPFGQGLSLNSMQATGVFQTIANGGQRIAPTLVKGTVDDKKNFTPATAPVRTQVVTPETAKTVTSMLESVVDDGQGTGANARIPGYRVAGKTGTADRIDPVSGKYDGFTSSFIGFAPADNPQLVVSVTIQRPTNGRGGGALSAPVFQQVMSFALQTRKVPPTGTEPPNLPVEW